MPLPDRDRASRLRGLSPAPPRRAPVPSSLLLVVLLVAACTDRAERAATAPEVTFRTLAGERLALREAAGPVLVSFWSTSCTICLAEMPYLAALHTDYAPRGLALIAVAMPHDPPNAVLELAEARALPFPVALDIDGAVLAAFEPVPGTPTSVLIGADGRVLERHSGPTDFPALRARLDALLGAAPSARSSSPAAPVAARPVRARG